MHHLSRGSHFRGANVPTIKETSSSCKLVPLSSGLVASKLAKSCYDTVLGLVENTWKTTDYVLISLIDKHCWMYIYYCWAWANFARHSRNTEQKQYAEPKSIAASTVDKSYNKIKFLLQEKFTFNSKCSHSFSMSLSLQ